MILGSLDDFLVGLQTVARVPQELTDGAVTDRVPFGTQFLRELLGTLTRPPQGRFRIAPRHGVNQRIEIGLQRGIFLGQPTPSGPGFSNPVPRHHLRMRQFLEASGHRIPGQPSRTCHDNHSAES